MEINDENTYIYINIFLKEPLTVFDCAHELLSPSISWCSTAQPNLSNGLSEFKFEIQSEEWFFILKGNKTISSIYFVC